jgi:hypothetical protein
MWLDPTAHMTAQVYRERKKIPVVSASLQRPYTFISNSNSGEIAAAWSIVTALAAP